MRIPPLAYRLLLLAVAAAGAPPAVAGDPPRGAAVRPIDDTSFAGADGRLRLLYRPRFLDAKDLLEDVRRLGLPTGANVDLDGPRGRILVTSSEAALPAAREALDWLDVAPPEVLVEVTVVQTVKRRRRETGGHALFDRDGVEGAPDTFFRSLRYDFEPDSWLRSELLGGLPFQGTSVAVGQSRPSDLFSGAVDVVLRSLAAEGESDFLASPALCCTEGVPAVLSSTVNLPTSVFQRSLDGVSRFTTTTEKAGVSLEVTAVRIGADRVTVRLHPWVRQVADESTPGEPSGAPVLDVRELDTVLTLADGQSALVGGLDALRRVKDRRGLPWLDRLPALDSALSGRTGDVEESELLFLVRPRILRPGRGPAPVLPPGEEERLLHRGPSRARVASEGLSR